MATVTTTGFELTGADGGPLRGRVLTGGGGVGRPAVVMCHGFKGFMDWGCFPRLADRLAHAGITAVAFNFSGSGVGPDGESYTEPERFAHATLSNDVTDIGIVCAALQRGELHSAVATPTRLGLFGHSRGGGTALLYAAAHDVAGLVTWAAIGTGRRWPQPMVDQWRRDGRLNIVNARTGDVLPLYTDVLDDLDRHEADTLDFNRAAGAIRAPWLQIHGADDETVSIEEARELHRTASSEHAVLRVFETGTHTLGARHPWAGPTPELAEAFEDTVAWFTKCLF